MKVRELIEMLKAVDGDREVIMQKDSEGNGYSPLADSWEGAYKAKTTWYGYAGLEELTEKDIEQGYGEEDVIQDGVLALILCPTN